MQRREATPILARLVEPTRRLDARLAPLLWPLVAVVSAFKLWLASGLTPIVHRPPAADELLFVRLAASLADGQWLGTYDKYTLAKGPLYPLWLAAVHHSGVPLLIAEAGLAVAAGVVLVAVLRRNGVSSTALAALFTLYALHPAQLTFTRVAPGPTYASLAVLLFAALAALLFASRARRRVELPALAVGLLLGLMELMRAETPWLIPALLVAAPVVMASAQGAWPRLRRFGWVVCLVLAPLLGVTKLVELQNLRHYGSMVKTELESDFFGAAVGALARVRHAQRRRFVPVPREARARIYAYSPAFAELRPFLEGHIGRSRTRQGCRMVGVCDELSSHFFWALRDAAAAAGHHESLPAAQAFYLRIASEVNRACQRSQLVCLGERVTLRPVLSAQDVPHIVKSWGEGLWLVAGLAKLGLWTPPVVAPDETVALFERVTNHALPSQGSTGRARLIGWISSIYRVLLPVLLCWALVAFVTRCVTIPRRGLSALVTFGGAALAGVLALTAVLAVIDATAFAAIRARLALPAYSLVVVFCAVSVAMHQARPDGTDAPLDAPSDPEPERSASRPNRPKGAAGSQLGSVAGDFLLLPRAAGEMLGSWKHTENSYDGETVRARFDYSQPEVHRGMVDKV